MIKSRSFVATFALKLLHLSLNDVGHDFETEDEAGLIFVRVKLVQDLMQFLLNVVGNVPLRVACKLKASLGTLGVVQSRLLREVVENATI